MYKLSRYTTKLEIKRNSQCPYNPYLKFNLNAKQKGKSFFNEIGNIKSVLSVWLFTRFLC